MYPATIESYFVPETIGEAVSIAADHGDDAYYIAGGQSLMQAIKSRLVRPGCLVDLQRVPELRRKHRSDGLTIGAMVRYRDLAADRSLSGGYSALRDAASHVGDRQVRNRGTIGGSVCWNYISACMPAVNLGLGSRLTLMSAAGGERILEIDDFLGAPLETARAEGELLLSLSFPEYPERSGSAYRKWSLLTDGLPVVGICVLVSLDEDGRCRSARISIGGLVCGPTRCTAAEEALIGARAEDVEQHGEAMDIAARIVSTHGDLWADEDYRRTLIRVLGRETTGDAFSRAAVREEADG